MFKHIYVNSLKIFLREKNTVFWLLLFPMILAIFFKMAFSGLTDDESFEIIPVAVVCDEENEEAVNIYKGILSGLKDMLDITYTDEKGADKLLDEGKISAYLTVEYRENMPMLSMTIKENLINQSIVKEVTDKINEGVRLVMSGSVDENRISDLMNVENVLNNVQLSGEKQDFIAAWFYTILGMAAMYGSLIGLTIIQMIQANQSEEAMRFNLAPASKMKGFSAVFAAGATVHSVNMLLIYLYLRYIMNINFLQQAGLYYSCISYSGNNWYSRRSNDWRGAKIRGKHKAWHMSGSVYAWLISGRHDGQYNEIQGNAECPGSRIHKSCRHTYRRIS